MKDQFSEGLARLYERAARSGVLYRPVPRRAYETVYLAYKRLFEAGPIDGLRRVVADGSTVVDVGANIGFFSLRFGRWVGPTGRVVAIEPEARNIASLRRRVQRAGLSDVITCVQAVAADRSGQLRLALTPGHPGDHHLAETGKPVQAVTLDELFAQDPRQVSLIKIDVQGAETMVIAGARRLLERQRPAVFVELHEPSLARLGSSPRELLDTLVQLGFAGHKLTRRGVGPAEDTEELLARLAQASSGYIDVLFIAT